VGTEAGITVSGSHSKEGRIDMNKPMITGLIAALLGGVIASVAVIAKKRNQRGYYKIWRNWK